MDAETKEMLELVLKRMDERFDAVDARFDRVDDGIGSIDKRLSSIEEGFDEYKREFFKFRLQVDRRFTDLDALVANVRRDMHGHFDTLYMRMGDVQLEYKMLQQGLRRLEDSSVAHAQSVKDLTDELIRLRIGYDRMNTHLDDLEAELRGDHDA